MHLTYLLLDSSLTLDNSPVFQSQIIDRIRYQRASGIEIGLVSTAQNMDMFDDVAGRILREVDVPYLTFPHRNVLRNIFTGARMLRRFSRRHPAGKVYVRGIWGAVAHLLAFPFGGPPLIYDFRGDIVAEAQLRNRSRLRLLILRILCRFAVRRAERVLCVSHPASELLRHEYKRPNSVVFPSAVDSGRFFDAQSHRGAVRKSLGVGDEDVLFVYSGSVNKYQMVPDMLRLWSALSDDPGIKYLLLLSRQPSPDEQHDFDGIISQERIKIRSVPRDEVPDYLAASDIGFLLRQDHPLNAVASPVKFGEYLASGLAVVTSAGLGDVSRVVEERSLGVLVPPEDIAVGTEKCRAFLEEFRKDKIGYERRARQVITDENMDWKSHIEIWKQLLGVGSGDASRAA